MATKKKPDNERCLSITREVMQWTTCVHVRVGERITESHFNDGQPYAAHPRRSGELNLGNGSLGLTAYINTERSAPAPTPLSLSHAPLSYRDLHLLEARDLRDMARTIELLAKRLDKLRDQLGYAQEFGEHVVRLAAAVDAKWIALHRRDYKVLTGQDAPNHGGSWIWCEVRNARRMLDAIRDHHLPTEPLVETAREALS